MKQKFNYIYGAFVIACIVLTFLVSSIVETSNKVIVSNMQSYETMLLVDETQTTFLEMLSGVRGYFATSKKEYLEDFNNNQHTMTELFEELDTKAKTNGNTDITSDIKAAKRSYETWLRYNKQAIAMGDKLKNQKKFAEYITRTSPERRPLSTNFQRDLEDLKEAEDMRLKLSTQKAETAKGLNKWVSYLSPILAVLSIFIVFKLYENTQRELEKVKTERDQLEEALMTRRTRANPPAKKKTPAKRTTAARRTTKNTS